MTQHLVPLQHGLDLSSPPSMVEPGRLLSVENYEIIDQAGPKRADGFLRWDGASQIRTESVMAFRYASGGTGPAEYINGRYLYKTGQTKDYPFGIALSVDTTNRYVLFFLIDEDAAPTIGDTIRLLGVSSGTASIVAETNVKPADDFSTIAVSASARAAYIAQRMDGGGEYSDLNNGPRAFLADDQGVGYVSDGVQEFNSPTRNQVIGLHYFNKRAYAVAEAVCQTYSKLTQQVFPGDFIQDAGGTTYQILKAELVSGSWSGGGAGDVGKLHLRRLGFGTQSDADLRRYPIDVNGSLDGRTLVRRAADASAANRTFTGSSPTITSAASSISYLHETNSERQAMDRGMVASITITNAGTGYTVPPVVAITGGGGAGATAVAVINSSGVITALKVINPGRGYTSAPTVTISGGSGAAGAATAVLSTWAEAGWRAIDQGWLIPFDAGSSAAGYLPKLDRSRIATSQETTYTNTSTFSAANPDAYGNPQNVIQDLDYPGAIGGSSAPNSTSSRWLPTTGTYLDPALFGETLGTDGAYVVLNANSFFYEYTSNDLGFTNFTVVNDFLPENAVIKGVEVKVAYDQFAGSLFPGATSDIPLYRMRATLFKTSDNNAGPSARTETRLGDTRAIDMTVPTGATTDTEVTFGGATDTWGNGGSLTWDQVKAGEFGVAIGINAVRTQAANFNFGFRIDRIRINIYYQTPTIRLYARDPTNTSNVIQCDLIDYVVDTGDFRNGDATGFLQVANLTPYGVDVDSADISHTIKDNWNIYADTSFSNRVATSTGTMEFNGLPSKSALLAADNAKYQFLSANFFANEDWDSIYGVSGAGRAFQFDGTYFSKIYAIPLQEENSTVKDAPRHVAQHRFRLALGYKSGSVLFSAEGEPSNFDGLVGAAEVGLGDRVTGMKSLAGTYLAVFGENSVHGIRESTLETVKIIPNSGAIEYTLASFGNRLVYCNSYGIWTLDQSEKYGDFVGFPLSYNVTPFLLPRLTRYTSAYAPASTFGIAAAYPVRSKNQYRLWFADGRQLVMTLVGPEQRPEFTILRYNLPINGPSPTGVSLDKIIPQALCSETDANGTEQMLWFPDLSFVETITSTAGFDADDFVPHTYKLDHFWFHDGGGAVFGIPAHLQLNFWNKDNPFQHGTLKKMRVEGKSRNIGSLTVTTAKEYVNPDPSTAATQTISIPRTVGTGIPLSQLPQTNIQSVAETGRLIGIRFDNYEVGSTTTYSDEFINLGTFPTTPEPPHYLQLLLLTVMEGKPDG